MLLPILIAAIGLSLPQETEYIDRVCFVTVEIHKPQQWDADLSIKRKRSIELWHRDDFCQWRLLTTIELRADQNFPPAMLMSRNYREIDIIHSHKVDGRIEIQVRRIRTRDVRRFREIHRVLGVSG